jgi:hypothetical protein
MTEIKSIKVIANCQIPRYRDETSFGESGKLNLDRFRSLRWHSIIKRKSGLEAAQGAPLAEAQLFPPVVVIPRVRVVSAHNGICIARSHLLVAG